MVLKEKLHVCILGMHFYIHLRQIPSVEVEMDSEEAKTGGRISTMDVVGRIQARDDGDPAKAGAKQRQVR